MLSYYDFPSVHNLNTFPGVCCANALQVVSRPLKFRFHDRGAADASRCHIQLRNVFPRTIPRDELKVVQGSPKQFGNGVSIVLSQRCIDMLTLSKVTILVVVGSILLVTNKADMPRLVDKLIESA